MGLVLGRGDVRRNKRAWIALAVAALFTGSLFDDPGPLAWALFWCALSVAVLLPKVSGFDDAWHSLAWALFWCALSVAVLLPKVSGFDDAWHWGARLVIHAVGGIGKPFADLRRFGRSRQRKRANAGSVMAVLGLPLVGGALFVTLFAAANPLIAQTLAAIRLPSVWQILLWIFVAVCVWPSLRPHRSVMRLAARLPDPEPVLPGTSLPSVLIALALFNAIFAVQNALDIAFLWSGGALPAGMTQTEYVHRGAYPLIGTALIAGVMALAML
ncbi:DUF4153 domain-containing protein, partial [Sphingomonas sp. Leaf226]|uniref:DUF4153 domain-containing protein n=1 Tax=Sphingomonas sp. Leaf226 TaxID=1735691 RepID=UPI003A5C8701